MPPAISLPVMVPDKDGHLTASLEEPLGECPTVSGVGGRNAAMTLFEIIALYLFLPYSPKANRNTP